MSDLTANQCLLSVLGKLYCIVSAQKVTVACYCCILFKKKLNHSKKRAKAHQPKPGPLQEKQNMGSQDAKQCTMVLQTGSPTMHCDVSQDDTSWG